MRQLKAEYYKMKYSRASKWVLVFMAFIFFIPFVVGNDTLFMTFGDYRNIDSMHDPEILILDEPINGLDPIGIAEIRTFIEDLSKNRGKTILISSHILSEIDVLADDIGIIDKGVLIEEGSMKELEEKNGKYVHFKVSDNAQAARILSVYYKESNFKVSGNQDINVYNLSISIPDIVRSFVQEGVDVMDAHLCEDTLEDYFKKVTGGEGIA